MPLEKIKEFEEKYSAQKNRVRIDNAFLDELSEQSKQNIMLAISENPILDELYNNKQLFLSSEYRQSGLNDLNAVAQNDKVLQGIIKEVYDPDLGLDLDKVLEDTVDSLKEFNKHSNTLSGEFDLSVIKAINKHKREDKRMAKKMIRKMSRHASVHMISMAGTGIVQLVVLA